MRLVTRLRPFVDRYFSAPLLIAVLTLIGYLPLEVVRLLAKLLAFPFMFVATRLRFGMADALLKHFPEKAHTIRRQCLQNLMINALEYAWLWHNPRVTNHHFQIVKGEEILIECAGKVPVLILAGHFGQWEVIPVMMTLRGYKGNGIYREGRHDWIERILKWRNRRPPFRGFLAGMHGVGQMLSGFRDNEFSYMLIDQVPKEGAGEWVNFFGQEAYTMRLAAKLSTTPNLRTLFATTLRTKDGFAITLQDITSSITTMSAKERSAYFTHTLEAIVKAHPEHYLWLYPRYRKPRKE